MKLRDLFVFFFLIAASVQLTAQDKMNTKKWRKSERDSMERAQHFYDEGLRNMALPIFERLQRQHPTESYLKFISAVCGLDRSDWHARSYQFLQEIYSKNKKVHNIEFYLAKAAHLNYKFDEANSYLDEYEKKNKKPEPAVKKEIPLLRNYIANGKKLVSNPKPAKISNFGGPVNTNNSEYVPVLNADESVMIFTYRGERSFGGLQNAYNEPDEYGIPYEDVFVSNKTDGQWQDPQPIPAINTKENDAAICFSHDGQTLFIFRDDRTNGGDIYVSKLEGTEWSAPEEVYGDINTRAWEGSITLFPDERMVIFSSERPGGYGGKDLYLSVLDPSGSWGSAVNLGDKINTPYDDDAPFIHPDGRTLIFSSKGYNSMGGFDIFRSVLGADSAWSVPENLGYPINTPDDDIYYVLSPDGKRGYYASGKEGGSGLQDIYVVEPGIEGYTPSVAVLKGTITLKKTPVKASVDITVSSNGKHYNLLHSNSENGKYLATLSGGEEYVIRYKLEGHPDQVKMVSLVKQEGYTEQVIDIDFDKTDTVPVAVTNTVVETPTVVTTPTVAATPTTTATETQTEVKLFDGLQFRVQIAAYKMPENYKWNHLNGMGDVEKVILDDGVTRFTIGGKFGSLDDANAHCKKVRAAGQQDAFVTAIYNGKRVYLDELEAKGLIPKLPK